MKILHNKNLVIALALGAVTLFSSCSRQMTTISKTDKLMHSQNIEQKSNIKSNSILDNQKTDNPVISENKPMAQVILPSTMSAKEGETKTVPKKNLKQLAQIFQPTIKNVVKKQLSSISNIKANQNIASYKSKNQTESWLGLAITCLVVAIILAVLGFGFAAAVFWEIGIIILVIAVVFFILWLMAEAVAG